MSHKPGSYLRGIKTLDDLRARCVVDEDTSCWHWKGAFSHGKGQTKVPATYLPVIGKTTTGMRAAVLLSRGLDSLPPGRKVWARCMRRDCCNPAHMMTGTQAELGEFIAKHDLWKGNAKRVAGITKRMREQSRFSMEEIAAMRASGMNGKQLAEAHGICKAHACRILRGAAWR